MVCSILRDSKENAWLEINKNFVSLLMIKLDSFNIMALSLKWNMGHFIILSLATCKGTCTLEGIAVCYVLTGFIKFLFYYFFAANFFCIFDNLGILIYIAFLCCLAGIDLHYWIQNVYFQFNWISVELQQLNLRVVKFHKILRRQGNMWIGVKFVVLL